MWFCEDMPVVVLDITVNKDTFDKDSFVLEKSDDGLSDLEGRDIDMKAPKVNPPTVARYFCFLIRELIKQLFFLSSNPNT